MNRDQIGSQSVKSNEPTNIEPLAVEDNTPGAHLSKPIETHNVQELRW